jgi:hypothetical protein
LFGANIRLKIKNKKKSKYFFFGWMNTGCYFCESMMITSIGAIYKGKQVNLNQPKYSALGSKKFVVYVKDPDSGGIKKINFGQKGMSIKRKDPNRRRSFRARHKCSTANDILTPRYWSCKMW